MSKDEFLKLLIKCLDPELTKNQERLDFFIKENGLPRIFSIAIIDLFCNPERLGKEETDFLRKEYKAFQDCKPCAINNYTNQDLYQS